MNTMTLFAIAGIGLIILSMAMFRHTKRFASKCITANGRVTRYAEDNEGDVCYPVVSFKDRSGKTHEITCPSARPLPPIGQVAQVTYDPTYPSNAWVTGSIAPWVIPSVVGMAGIALIIARWALSHS